MDSELQKQLKALKEMHEDDFTRDIVKPLFESMGYNRVDFNGVNRPVFIGDQFV